MTDNYKDVRKEGRKVGRREAMMEKGKRLSQRTNLAIVALSNAPKAVVLAPGHASSKPNYVWLRLRAGVVWGNTSSFIYNGPSLHQSCSH